MPDHVRTARHNGKVDDRSVPVRLTTGYGPKALAETNGFRLPGYLGVRLRDNAVRLIPRRFAFDAGPADWAEALGPRERAGAPIRGNLMRHNRGLCT